MAFKTYYPRENVFPNTQAMALWYDQLKDIEYKVLEVALQKWVTTHKYSPAISEIRETVAEIARADQPPIEWGEGWKQVMDAVAHYGYYREAEALESMDEITREACKRIGFINICLSENITADRACFRQIYEQIAERKKTAAMLPAGLQQLIKKTSVALIGGSNDET